MINKNCPLCGKPIKNKDIVVALLMGRIVEKETGYDLEAWNQTISSHVWCLEGKAEPVAPEAK